jgi:hypothetical protein
VSYKAGEMKEGSKEVDSIKKRGCRNIPLPKLTA